MSLFCFLAASCTQQFPTDATVLVVAHRMPRSTTRCGVVCRCAQCARCTRCGAVFRDAGGQCTARGVCAVHAVRSFVTPVKFGFLKCTLL